MYDPQDPWDRQESRLILLLGVSLTVIGMLLIAVGLSEQSGSGVLMAIAMLSGGITTLKICHENHRSAKRAAAQAYLKHRGQPYLQINRKQERDAYAAYLASIHPDRKFVAPRGKYPKRAKHLY